MDHTPSLLLFVVSCSLFLASLAAARGGREEERRRRGEANGDANSSAE